MKTIFIVLIVIAGYFALAVGCNCNPPAKASTTPEPTPPAPSCSTINCGTNEECQENDDHSFTCKCVSNAKRNHATEKCEIKYQWVNNTAELFKDTRLVLVSLHNEIYYIVSRLIRSNGDEIPFTAYNFEFKNTINPAFSTDRLSYDRMEVLLAEPGHYEWIKSPKGTAIPDNAIEGGHIKNETVYICRMNYYDNDYVDYYIGAVKSDEPICYSEHDDFSASTYAVLTYKL